MTDVAKSACFAQAQRGNTPRLTYQAARALLAKSDVSSELNPEAARYNLKFFDEVDSFDSPNPFLHFEHLDFAQQRDRPWIR